MIVSVFKIICRYPDCFICQFLVISLLIALLILLGLEFLFELFKGYLSFTYFKTQKSLSNLNYGLTILILADIILLF